MAQIRINDELKNKLKAVDGATYNDKLSAVLNQANKEETGYTHPRTFNVDGFVSPHIDAELIYNYSIENFAYKKVKQNLALMIFTDVPTITYYDKNGDPVEDISKWLEEMVLSKNCNLWKSMRIAFNDMFDYGSSIFNPVFENVNGKVEITSLRHLPAYSFDTSGGEITIYSKILTGIGYNDAGDFFVYQINSSGTPTKLDPKYLHIVKDPTSDDPAGDAWCIPLINLLALLKFALNAQTQKVNRVGAPVPVLKIDNSDGSKITQEEIDYIENIAKRINKDQVYVLPEHATTQDPFTPESNAAMETIDWLIKMVMDQFNPGSFITKDGTMIGGSSKSEMDLTLRFISGIHEILEDAFEELIQKVLEANGYDGRVEIKIPDPEIDTTDADLRRADIALKTDNMVLKNEVREMLHLEPRDDLKEQFVESGGSFDFMGDFENKAEILKNTHERLSDGE